MTCPNCKEQIKDGARVCPHCTKSTASATKKLLVGALVGAVIGLLMFLSHSH